MTSAIEEYNDVLQSGKIKACKKLKAVYQHLAKTSSILENSILTKRQLTEL